MRDERGLIYSYHSSLRINNNNLLLRLFIEKKRSSLEPSLGGGGGFLFISPRTPVKKKSKKSARLNFRVHPQTQKRRRRRSEKTQNLKVFIYLHARTSVCVEYMRALLSFFLRIREEKKCMPQEKNCRHHRQRKKKSLSQSSSLDRFSFAILLSKKGSSIVDFE